jgi:hypothetical protein
MSKSDFDIADHGSIILFAPLTAAAQEWVDEHIPDDAHYIGSSLAVERRYAQDILDGIRSDGLEVL